MQQVLEKMASSCAREGLDYILGIKSSLESLRNTRTEQPRQIIGRYPWRHVIGLVPMAQPLRMWSSDGLDNTNSWTQILKVFSKQKTYIKDRNSAPL